MSQPESSVDAVVAYVISAYQLPEMLVRLVERLDAPGTHTFIHVDARTPDRMFRAMTGPLAGRPNVEFLPRHACRWGDFGHVRATLDGLRALIGSGRPFDYVVLLTGQDYPLRSNARITETLGRADGKIFMRASRLPTDLWTDGGTYRYENRFFHIAGRPFSFPGAPFSHAPLNRAWWRIARRLGLYRRFPDGLEPYGGSSYWMLPADAARYVVDRAVSDPALLKFFRYVRVPDEIFFQTLIMNSPLRTRCVDDDLRFIDWREGGDSPRILTCDDLSMLLSSNALFARKFDPGVDAEVLDRIDRTVAV
jgi:hypothetical protein